MEEDYAIIIGIQNYPDLDDAHNGFEPLSGPENDARGFEEWVKCTNGGAVPSHNIGTILSSNFGSSVNDASVAKPTVLEIAGAFEKLRKLSEKRQQKMAGSKIGRRLYIFMSGHGIAPTPFGTRIEKEAALLMANVDSSNITSTLYHIPGIYTATWFCENECFDEVFLFMDCCRDVKITSSTNNFLPNKGAATNTTRFYAFAAKWSRRAKETMIDGKMQGVFTKALLSALWGACAYPDPDPAANGSGVITGAALKSFLFRNVKKFMDPQFKEDEEDLEPDIHYEPKGNEGKNIVIRKGVPLQMFPVIINISAGVTGTLKIRYDSKQEVASKPGVNGPGQWTISLPIGSYLVAGVKDGDVAIQEFDVDGIEQAGKEVIVNL